MAQIEFVEMYVEDFIRLEWDSSNHKWRIIHVPSRNLRRLLLQGSYKNRMYIINSSDPKYNKKDRKKLLSALKLIVISSVIFYPWKIRYKFYKKE